MGRAQGDWCILRTSGPRTLRLATSLADAGFQVWTPIQTITKRVGRARERVERPAPITPTFVFARAAALADLIQAASSPVSPHPAFSVLRRSDHTVPLISEVSLRALRAEEERHRVALLKKMRRVVEPGSKVRLTEGAFAGMTGVVERGSGKEAVVNFGAGFVVSIASYLLPDDVIQSANKPGFGIAA